MRPARILHAPWNIGGNPIGLSRAERELGFESRVLVLGAHEFGYEADIDLELAGRGGRGVTVRRAIESLRELRYDVIHFNFGQTIHHWLDRRGRLHTELPLLKRANRKRILATFQGDDARPPHANPAARSTRRRGSPNRSASRPSGATRCCATRIGSSISTRICAGSCPGPSSGPTQTSIRPLWSRPRCRTERRP